MTRSEINKIIKNSNYKSYLEIGNDICLDEIECDYKVGTGYDDSFFCENKDVFDMVFIRGQRESKEIYISLRNSLEILTNDGIIIFNNYIPIDKEVEKV